MFLKRQRRRAGGEEYDYWSLVRSVQTARGPRHRVVARLGKLDGVEQKAARGWHDLDALLELNGLRTLPDLDAEADETV